MRTIRFTCLAVMTALYMSVLAPDAGARKPLCCWDFASYCANECQSHGGILVLDCPAPSWELCVCKDSFPVTGGPDCP